MTSKLDLWGAENRLTPFFSNCWLVAIQLFRKYFVCGLVFVYVWVYVYIYIYLYGEKSYRTGLAFIKYSSGMCKWQSRVIQPQMNHNYSTWLNLLYLLFIVWPEGEPTAVIPLKKATLLTPNKAGPGLCSITSCTSGSANRKCKSPGLLLIRTSHLMPQNWL